jgi:hypothetical protein
LVKVLGKIYSQDINCSKCNELIRIYNKPAEVYCRCGAEYKLMKVEILEENIEMEYDFTQFTCIHNDYTQKCKNPCPSSHLYCRLHSSPEAIENTKKEIQTSEERLNKIKDKLTALENSRSVWLINEISGVDE